MGELLVTTKQEKNISHKTYMKITALLKIALKNLRTRRLRSWLTILGIVIGVFLVITLLSLSEGIKESINSQLKSLGKDIIFVMPGEESNFFVSMMAGSKLEEEDVKIVEKNRGVENVVPMTYGGGVMRYKGEAKQVFLVGLPIKKSLEILKQYQGWDLKAGEWPDPLRREIIVGGQVEKDLFKKNIKVGEEASINGVKVKITGILQSLGSKSDDSSVYVDESLYQQITGASIKEPNVLLVKVKEGYDPNKVAQEIKQDLEERAKRQRGSEKGKIMVLTSEKMGDIAENILGTIQAAIIALASISILVGGIGIMNTMFTSVRERVREIGIMKAIGATNTTISLIFLLEAGMIGFVGGVGGTVLGVSFAKMIEAYFQVHPVLYLKAYLSWGIILFGLIFSFILGCLSGYLPARSAAKLRAADALRRFE